MHDWEPTLDRTAFSHVIERGALRYKSGGAPFRINTATSSRPSVRRWVAPNLGGDTKPGTLQCLGLDVHGDVQFAVRLGIAAGDRAEQVGLEHLGSSLERVRDRATRRFDIPIGHAFSGE